MKNIVIIAFIICSSCNEENTSEIKQAKAFQQIRIPPNEIVQNDTLLKIKNGYWFYADTLYSGTINDYFPSRQLKTTATFSKGKEEGWYHSFYPDGRKESDRCYHAGEKDGIHTGWWNNGNLRFEYHFSNGDYDGDYKDYYQSGKPLKYIIYQNGNEISGKGWRENGKLFMNYVMKDKRRYGLMNAQLCYSLQNGKGEFVRSTSDTLR